MFVLVIYMILLVTLPDIFLETQCFSMFEMPLCVIFYKLDDVLAEVLTNMVSEVANAMVFVL